MKIKTKKQLNLPQLIEWGFNNPELAKGRVYSIDDENARFAPYVSFLKDMSGVRIPCTITYNNTFTVEVEEQITEDTPLSMIIEIDEVSSCWVFENTTLKNIHETDCGTNTTKYYRDEDENMHIIWRDGRLIE